MKIWIHMISVKFLLALLLTPAIKPIQKTFGLNEEAKELLQFWLVVFLLIYSVCLRGYREDTSNNFEESPYEGKFIEFQKRFEEVTTKGGKP